MTIQNNHSLKASINAILRNQFGKEVDFVLVFNLKQDGVQQNRFNHIENMSAQDSIKALYSVIHKVKEKEEERKDGEKK